MAAAAAQPAKPAAASTKRKPRGPAPKGKEWDHASGSWKPAGAPATAAVGPSRRATLRAVQAVCEYVADEWAAQVAERSGVALAEVFPGLASRPSGAENVWAHEAEEQKLHELAFGTAAKRQKVEAGGAAAKQTSTKQASMAKAAKGTKSITAFFGRKKKRAP